MWAALPQFSRMRSVVDQGSVLGKEPWEWKANLDKMPNCQA